jgi:hypothetical protein
MFTIEVGMFSIGTIVVPIPVRLEQHVNLIISTCLNLVEQVYVLVLLVSFDITYQTNIYITC